MRLREQIAVLQRRRAEPAALAVPEALFSLFPAGGLRPGAAYAIAPDATPLLLALLGGASREGAWSAVVGFPELSATAAAGYGVDLGRLVLVPRPEERWLQAAAAAAEVFPLVALRPARRVTDAEAARLEGRLRDRGGALLVLGAWPGAEARLETDGAQWLGIGQGHGVISGRAVTVSLTARRSPRPRTTDVLLPGPSGGVERIDPAWQQRLQKARPARDRPSLTAAGPHPPGTAPVPAPLRAVRTPRGAS